jgi:transposase
MKRKINVSDDIRVSDAMRKAIQVLEQSVKRAKGKSIPFDTRVRVASLLIKGNMTQREIAAITNVSKSSVNRLNLRLKAFRNECVSKLQTRSRSTSTRTRSTTNEFEIDSNELFSVLKEKVRGAGSLKYDLFRCERQKIGKREHDEWIKEIMKNDCSLFLDELCLLFEKQFNIKVSVSTMCRCLKRRFNFTRKRLAKALSKQALTEKNLNLRRRFVSNWMSIDSFDSEKIGSNEEFEDQKRWRLKTKSVDDNALVDSNKQIFFIDETGCNRDAMKRLYGRSLSGTEARNNAGSANDVRGSNHSVIIACGVEKGVIAHEILVGDLKKTDNKRKRGTNRQDFCNFLRTKVAPAMIDSARKSGLDDTSQLYLIMDNASIHKGKIVSDALRAVSNRLHICYQPPYMPTIHPTEFINAQLKSKLKRVVSFEYLLNDSSESDDSKILKNVFKKTLLNNDLKTMISNILTNEIKVEDVENYFNHCGWH